MMRSGSLPLASRREAGYSSYVILNARDPCVLSARVPRRTARGSAMKAKTRPQPNDMRAEYEFDYSTAERGKYYRRLLKEGANIVVLEPDVAKAFRSSAAVNEALRSLLEVSESTRRLTTRSSGRSRAARASRAQGSRRTARR